MIITKERDEKNLGRRTEFPKLIIEEENISKNDVEETAAKTLSSREIITFLLFCTFFIVVVYMQLNVESSYAMNSAIQKALARNTDFMQINIETDYWTWVQNFINGLYTENYYDNFTIPQYKRHAIPNLNVVISPIRITQRRMKMIPNEDIYTKNYIKEGWASLGFGIYDSYDPEVEDNTSFSVYEYESGPQTFFAKGGYVKIIDIVNMTGDQANQTLLDLQSNGFTNNQTRLMIIDTVVYNSYTGFYTVVDLIAIFEANGLITTKIELFNIKQNYYDGFSGYFRLVCEACFCLLLIFYVIIEINEIIVDISNKKKEWEKEQKREAAREKRKQEIEEENKLEEGKSLGVTPEAPKKAGSESQSQEKLQEQKEQKNKTIVNSYKFLIGGIKEHYEDSWNWIDTAFLILSVVAMSIWADIIYKHVNKIQPLVQDDFRNAEVNEVFFSVANKMLTYSELCSINFILLFIKVLKYLGYWFERVSIIFKTLAYAKSDIFYFLIMYIIIFFAFVVMCHIYYGADLTNFGTILNSLKTLFLMLLGDLSYLDDMILLNKVLSFFFFIAFMTSMQFILVNMFIAFISNAYAAVNSFPPTNRLEEQLKQKHFLVKIQDIFKWIKNRMTNSKKVKEQEKQKQTKAKEIIQKSFEKKKQYVLSHQLQKNEEEEPSKKISKITSLFEDPSKEINEHNDDANKNLKVLYGGSTDEKRSNSKSSNSKGGLIGHSTDSDNIVSNSKLDELNEEDIDLDFKDDQEAEEHMQKSKRKQEEERAKIILTRMDWDKNFDQNQFFIEEPQVPSLLSEKQDVQGKKERELKCGKIMWASITFTLYAALYINLILFQLNVERNFWYNTAMKNAILALQYSDSFNAPQDITMILTYDQLIIFFENSYSNLAEQITQQETNFTGYYISKVNYILGDKFRLCFKLAEPNSNVEQSVFASDYLKSNADVFYQQDFVGIASQTQYKFLSDGYQQQGSYCQDVSFDPDIYNSVIQNLTDDRIISDQLQQLSVEFVTFEASQYVNTYTSIEFNFPSKGIVDQVINVFTMKLNPYKSVQDLIRLGFEGLYIILLIYNMFIFIQKLVSKNRQYERWKRVEIDTISEIERKQRYQKRPEWIRKWDALFTSFTYFDLIYFSLAITSIVLWIIYVEHAKTLDFELPPSEDESDFIPRFYRAQQLLMNYTNVVAINTIFLSVKVFDYMNKSKHMNMLSNTLYTAKEDTFYFLIIFSIFLFGFVGMAYISFGAKLADFNTLGNAVRKCFEITIGDFDYQALEKTNSTMAVIFFFPFNILFVFILTNIFLAIINEAYEANQLSSEDYENINFLSSIFYCMIPNEKQKSNKRKQQGIDKKSMQNDYLEVFEKLVVNLQISMTDIKAWAINCADEIKSELKKRTQLRNENREILLNKFKKMKTIQEGRSGGAGVVAHGKRFDEIECYKKRLQYWDYIRNGLQFISFQNKVLNAVLKQKEKEIQEKTEYYYKEKERTQEIYKYLALLEKPVEERLEQIMNYRKVLKLLEEEKNLLINQEEKEEADEAEEETKQQDKGKDKSMIAKIQSDKGNE